MLQTFIMHVSNACYDCILFVRAATAQSPKCMMFPFARANIQPQIKILNEHKYEIDIKGFRVKLEPMLVL